MPEHSSPQGHIRPEGSACLRGVREVDLYSVAGTGAQMQSAGAHLAQAVAGIPSHAGRMQIMLQAFQPDAGHPGSL